MKGTQVRSIISRVQVGKSSQREEERVGVVHRIMFAVVITLNLLIAMMADSFVYAGSNSFDQVGNPTNLTAGRESNGTLDQTSVSLSWELDRVTWIWTEKVWITKDGWRSYEEINKTKGYWVEGLTPEEVYQFGVKVVFYGNRGVSQSSNLLTVRMPGPEPNRAPYSANDHISFEISEGASAGVVQMRSGLDLKMIDWDQELLTYTLHGYGRHMFRVRNTAGALDAPDVAQIAEITYSGSGLDYERQSSYELELRGTDGEGQYSTITVYIDVLDEHELDSISGNIHISGTPRYNRTLTADLSGIRDRATGVQIFNSSNSQVEWRWGECPSPSYGLGVPEINTSVGSGDSYSPTLDDVGHNLSAWIIYLSPTGIDDSRWFCGDTSVVSKPFDSSMPSVSTWAEDSSILLGEAAVFIVSRQGASTASPLHLNLRHTGHTFEGSSWVNKVFIPAGESRINLSVTPKSVGELKLEVLLGEDYNVSAGTSVAKISVGPANVLVTGGPVIKGALQLEETLTVDTSHIVDENGLGIFSYRWERVSPGGERERISNGETYEITHHDIGFSFVVIVTYLDGDGFREDVESQIVGPVVSPEVEPARIVSIYHRYDYSTAFNSPGEVRVEDILVIMVQMTKGIKKVSINRPELPLYIGNQRHILVLGRNGKEDKTGLLSFRYKFQDGDSGLIRIPENGLFATDWHGNVVDPPDGADFSHNSLNFGYVDVLPQTQTSQTEEQTEEQTVNSSTHRGDAFTARFQNVPDEHDGDYFDIQLSLSAPLQKGSKRRLRDQSFQVTNGSVIKVWKVSGRSDLWGIRVQPDSLETVTVMLPLRSDCNEAGALCTSDGQVLSNGLAKKIQGPVTISISDALANENKDSMISFQVTLSRASSQTVTVDWSTEDRAAQSGGDYTEDSGTLVFVAGETRKTIEVGLLNDSIDEGSEDFIVNLSRPSGAHITDGVGVGTINNSDPAPEGWLNRMGRVVGKQAVDAVKTRVTGGGRTLKKTVGEGSKSSDKDDTLDWGNRIQEGGHFGPRRVPLFEDEFDAPKGREVAPQEIDEQTFLLDFGESSELVSNLSIWGRANIDHFNGAYKGQEVSGDVRTIFLGVDVEWEDWLAGVAVSNTRSDGKSRGQSVGDETVLDANFNSLYPYVRYSLSEHTDIWGMLGFSDGTMEIEGENKYKTGLGMKMGAGGVRHKLGPYSNGLTAALIGDLLLLRMESDAVTGEAGNLRGVQTHVGRARVMAEIGQQIDLGKGSTLYPRVEAGVQYDLDNDFSVLLSTGVRYTGFGERLFLEASGHGLLSGDDDKNWGMSMMLRLAPSSNKRGLSFSVGPSLGVSRNHIDEMQQTGDHNQLGLVDQQGEKDMSLNTEIGYGLSDFFYGGILTPYVGIGQGSNRSFRAGAKWDFMDLMRLNLEAKHTKRAEGHDERSSVMLYTKFKF